MFYNAQSIFWKLSILSLLSKCPKNRWIDEWNSNQCRAKKLSKNLHRHSFNKNLKILKLQKSNKTLTCNEKLTARIYFSESKYFRVHLNVFEWVSENWGKSKIRWCLLIVIFKWLSVAKPSYKLSKFPNLWLETRV